MARVHCRTAINETTTHSCTIRGQIQSADRELFVLDTRAMVQVVVADNADPTNPASELGKDFGPFENESVNGQNQSAHRRTMGSVPFCGGQDLAPSVFIFSEGCPVE